MEVVKVIRDCRNIKKRKILPGNKIEIFSAKKLRFKPAEYQKNDIGIVIVLPKKVKRFYWSLDGKITDINAGENRLYYRWLRPVIFRLRHAY